MRRQLLAAVLCMLASPVAAQPVYVTPDVPTDPDGPATYRPWDVVRHVPGPGPYSLALVLPGDPAIDALHKMDRPGNWLFSVEAPNDLAGLLGTTAEPRDVVRFDAGALSLFFDGDCVAPPVPLSSNVDALYLDGSDYGDLILSFDVPTALGPPIFPPSSLVRFKRFGPGPCDWTLVGLEIDFAIGGTYFPPSANLTSADRRGPEWIVTFDVPIDVGPPGIVTRTPGEIASSDGITWGLFRDLETSGAPGWPLASEIAALTCEANPGRIDSPTVQILMDKSLPTISILCPGSCSSGGQRYGIYQGTIASLFGAGVYDHAQISCDNVCPGTLTFPAPAASVYYLVVPHNGKTEGSYGVDSAGNERPQAVPAAARCVVPQNLTPCP
jgi:hypothetical protein